LASWDGVGEDFGGSWRELAGLAEAPDLHEARLSVAAAAFQRVTTWHRRHPISLG
jgi:hypothetical protein